MNVKNATNAESIARKFEDKTSGDTTPTRVNTMVKNNLTDTVAVTVNKFFVDGSNEHGDLAIQNQFDEDTSSKNNLYDAEPFDRYMYSLKSESKNYISSGPQKIDMGVHRTTCSLLLIAGGAGSSDATVIRANQDLYMHDTNFSCLPDLPTSD